MRSLDDRAKNGNGCILAADDIGESEADLHRRPIALTRDRHPATLRLDDEVVAGTRTPGSEARNRAPDQGRMLLDQLVGVQPKPLKRPSQKIVEHNVGIANEV